ncbi:MAG: Gfo/Idh/MocA family oxidoreductase, partial [Anaerolineaceae bacterium]
MNELRIGVIGLGFIGELHARIVYELPNAVLVAVSDVRVDVTKKIAAQFGCCGYMDYKEMILAGGLDAVSITLPDELHEEAAVFAIEHGLAVILEKPA